MSLEFPRCARVRITVPPYVCCKAKATPNWIGLLLSVERYVSWQEVAFPGYLLYVYL